MTRPRPAELPPAAWNETDQPFRDDVAVGALLAEAARDFAAEPALITGPPGRPSVLWTYAQIEAESRRIGRLMRGIGLRRGDHVCIIGYHTPATVSAILAALCTGVTYVPVDPRWPLLRRQEVLSAVRAHTVVAAPPDVSWLRDTPGIRHVITPEADGNQDEWRARTSVLWDEVSRASRPAEAAGFNLSGGTITDEQVAHYAEHVAALVREAAPESVLEIGFGSGLILRRLAPDVALLNGIDPAPHAVAAARQWSVEEDLFADFVEGFADEADGLMPGPHDTVLMASVVQFFPSERYLHSVLRTAARVVRPGGTMVIADVIPPGRDPVGGLLTIPASFFTGLSADEGWERPQIRSRLEEDGWPPDLAARYDVVLRRSPVPLPDRPGAGGSAAGTAPGPRVWTRRDIADLPDDPVPDPPGPEDTAYVIFTSGSTGTPKGVRIGHRSLVNLVQWINGRYRLGPGDQGLQVVSFSFDLSVFDVAGLLASGAALRMLADEHLAEPAAVARVLETEPVTFWNSAPASLGWTLPFVSPGRGRLRLVFLSGDWIPVSMPDEVRAFAPGATLVSLGGATETTVWSNDYVIGEVNPDWGSVPYGRPMPNARYYVLGQDLSVRPIDEAGDLYIAGTCLAQGYHDDPAQTDAAFVPDIIRGRGRMYRTGDRARWGPDGQLIFLGREDDQVKIRGFRVELGEIEAVIGRLPGVRAVAVVPVPAGRDHQLAAYYVATPGGPDRHAVRATCQDRLPPYMVPVIVTQMTAMPRNANGKVDRGELVSRARKQLAEEMPLWTTTSAAPCSRCGRGRWEPTVAIPRVMSPSPWPEAIPWPRLSSSPASAPSCA